MSIVRSNEHDPGNHQILSDGDCRADHKPASWFLSDQQKKKHPSRAETYWCAWKRTGLKTSFNRQTDGRTESATDTLEELLTANFLQMEGESTVCVCVCIQYL